MIIVYDINDTAYFIRPCPLISIGWSSSQSKTRDTGGSYNITLTGTLLDNEGSPIVASGTGTNSISMSWANSSKRPDSQTNSANFALGSILTKQMALRDLFAGRCNKIEVLPITADEPIFTFYPKFNSINFEQGVWVNTCNYTVDLTAGFLLDNNNKIIGAESYGAPSGTSLTDYIIDYGGFIEDYSENWSIEPEDGNGNTGPVSDFSNNNIIRSYRVTRSINATGHRSPSGDIGFAGMSHTPAIQAKNYVLKRIAREYSPVDQPASGYPHAQISNFIASGTINLAVQVFQGYNHSRVESIDKTAGTYSLTDTWLLSSGTAYENYNMSINSSVTEPFANITINGSIKGLSTIPASGNIFGGNALPSSASVSGNLAYQNAVIKYYQITNNGSFGPTCQVFKRAKNITNIDLNPIPLSVGLGTNEFTGEISYNIEYNNRPINIVSGVLSESISVSDTYPGDVFAVIPVIGRKTGPVLQYIGGRTEYQRNVNIDLVMSRYYAPSGSFPDASGVRNFGILTKPSLVEPFRTQINSIISAYSPAHEPGVRKYFLNPPTETWDAKTGNYSLGLNWVYELNK